jgi:hypothetical protein
MIMRGTQESFDITLHKDMKFENHLPTAVINADETQPYRDQLALAFWERCLQRHE